MREAGPAGIKAREWAELVGTHREYLVSVIVGRLGSDVVRVGAQAFRRYYAAGMAPEGAVMPWPERFAVLEARVAELEARLEKALIWRQP